MGCGEVDGLRLGDCVGWGKVGGLKVDGGVRGVPQTVCVREGGTDDCRAGCCSRRALQLVQGAGMGAAEISSILERKHMIISCCATRELERDGERGERGEERERERERERNGKKKEKRERNREREGERELERE